MRTDPMITIEEEVTRTLEEDMNPLLWNSVGCSAELVDIQPHHDSYLVTLAFDCEDELPTEAYDQMRELEWFLRDELTLPGLLVEAEEA